VATTEEKSAESIGTGILMPILQHRWRLSFGSRKIDTPIWPLAKAVVRCKVCYTKKELYVEFEENIKGEVWEGLSQIVKPWVVNHGSDRTGTPIIVRIDALSGNDEIYHAVEFVNASVEDHEVEFDYAKDGVVIHKVTVKFDDVQLLFPSIDKKE